MLPILVLLVAFSTPAVFQVVLNPTSSDVGITDSEIKCVWDLLPSGDNNAITQTIEDITLKINKVTTSEASALAFGQTIGIVGGLLGGTLGSANLADYLKAYITSIKAGNLTGFVDALRKYIQTFNYNIDTIVRAYEIPVTEVPPRQCPDEDKNYEMEEAWKIILSESTSDLSSLLTNENMITKGLYQHFTEQNYVFGAHLTSSALPPTLKVYTLCIEPFADFFSSLKNKSDLIKVKQSAAALKKAITDSVDIVCSSANDGHQVNERK